MKNSFNRFLCCSKKRSVQSLEIIEAEGGKPRNGIFRRSKRANSLTESDVICAAIAEFRKIALKELEELSTRHEEIAVDLGIKTQGPSERSSTLVGHSSMSAIDSFIGGVGPVHSATSNSCVTESVTHDNQNDVIASKISECTAVSSIEDDKREEAELSQSESDPTSPYSHNEAESISPTAQTSTKTKTKTAGLVDTTNQAPRSRSGGMDSEVEELLRMIASDDSVQDMEATDTLCGKHTQKMGLLCFLD